MFTLPRHKRTYASKKSKTSILLPRSVFPDSSAGIFNAFSIDNIRKNKQDADSSSLRTPYKQSNNAFAGQSSRKKRDEPLEIPAANFSGLEVSAVDMSTNITPNVSLHVKRDSLDAFDRLLMDKSEKNDMDIIAINTSDLKPNERAKINMSSDGSSRTSESPLIDLDSNDENECSKKKVRKKRRYMKKSKPLFGNITNQTNSIYDHKLEISKGLLKRSHTHIDSLMQNSRIRKILSDSLNRSQQIKRKCSNERVSIVPFSSTPLKKHCNKLKATSILSPILGNAISIENVSNQDCGRIEFNEKNSTNLSSISRSELNENETDFRTASFSGPPLVGFTSNSLAPLNRSSTPDMFDSNLDLQIELINDDNNKSLSNKSLALKKEDSIVKTGSVGEAKDISTDKNDEIMKEPSFTSIPKDTDTGMEENEFVNEYFYHSLENTNIDEENKTQNERDISNKTYLSNSSIVNEVIKSDSFFVTRRRNQHSGERNDTNKRLDYSEYIPFISLCDIDSSLSDNSQKSEIIQIPSSASGTSNHSINTSPDRSLIGSPDHSLNTSLDHSSKISPDRPLNASPDRSLNASPDHPLNKSPDHSTIISPDWPLNASADRSLNASPDHSSHTSLHHSLNTSPDHSLNALLDHSSKMSPDWPLNTSPDRSLNASPDHPLNKSPDHSPKISPDWPLNRSLNASPDHSSNTSLDHLLNTSPDHSLNTSPDHSLNTSPDHSLNTSPDHSSKISPYQPLNLSPDRSLNASPDHSLNTSRDHSSKTSLDRPLNVLPDRSLQASPDLTAPPPSEIIEILSSTLSNHSMNCLYSSPDHSFKSPKKASSSYSLKTSLGNSSSTSLNESDEKDVTIRRRSSFCLRSRRVVLPAAVKKPIPQKKTKLKRTKKAHNIIHEDEVASFDSTVYPFMNDSNVIGMQSYVLQPGKRWERSLSILKRMSTLNASVMPSRSVRIVNDAVSPSQGRKCRESIANVLRMQKRKDSHLDYTMNQTVTSRFFKSPSRRQTMRIVLEQLDFERSNLFEENDFSTLISPPDGEAAGFLSDTCNDTLIDLSRLSISATNVPDDPLIDRKLDETVRSRPTAADAVLRRCKQPFPLPFDECFPEAALKHCRKIGEGVYGEVFMYRPPPDANGALTPARVMKVIPVEGELIINGEHQKKFDEIISEIVIAMELSSLRSPKCSSFNRRDSPIDSDDVASLKKDCLIPLENCTDSFNRVECVRCVRGAYPARLLDLWELYDETKGSENDSPSCFGEEQLYVVLELENGGDDLEAFVFNNAEQACSVFHQVAIALAIAEQVYQFEHRDLHWGNILICPTDKKTGEYTLDGVDYSVPLDGVKATIIDYTLSRLTLPAVGPNAIQTTLFNDLSADDELFGAVGDYQFEIYRLMKKKNNNAWKSFEPYTNILWLHYTLDKMITALRYRRKDTNIHKHGIEKLEHLKNTILQFGSAQQFVSICYAEFTYALK